MKNVKDSNVATTNQLLSIAEVCRLLSVSKSSAYRLARSRAIASYRVGKVVRVKQEDLNAYLQRNLRRPVSELVNEL